MLLHSVQITQDIILGQPTMSFIIHVDGEREKKSAQLGLNPTTGAPERLDTCSRYFKIATSLLLAAGNEAR